MSKLLGLIMTHCLSKHLSVHRDHNLTQNKIVYLQIFASNLKATPISKLGYVKATLSKLEYVVLQY